MALSKMDMEVALNSQLPPESFAAQGWAIHERVNEGVLMDHDNQYHSFSGQPSPSISPGLTFGADGVCNGFDGMVGCDGSIDEGTPCVYLTDGHWFHYACAADRGISPHTRFAIGPTSQYPDNGSSEISVWALDITQVGPTKSGQRFRNSRKTCNFLTGCIDSSIRSQKAVGVKALQAHGFTVPRTVLIQRADQLSASGQPFLNAYSNGVWARPCPTRPRHGFVESREIKSLRELGPLWRETRRADPDGELMLQPKLRAKYSGVLTPGSLTFGPGNDGATAGKDARMYQIGPGNFHPYRDGRHGLPPGLLNASRVPDDEAPYIELVWPLLHNDPQFVQLRAGPDVPSVRDYVPTRMRVKDVYVVNHKDKTTVTDLQAWEALVPTFPPGTVVYHPGGSLTSHFGVHCVLNEVAYVTTQEPEVGSWIRPEKSTVPLSREAIRAGMLYGLKPKDADLTDISRHVSTSFFVLHNMAYDQSEYGSWLLGVSAGWLYQALAAACLGEFRHFFNKNAYTVNEHDRSGKAKVEAWFNKFTRIGSLANHSYNRESTFGIAMAQQPKDMTNDLMVATRSFLTHRWSGGYGGLNWGRCGIGTLRLWEAIQRVNTKPTPHATKTLIEAMNRCINLVHNGGNVFNKFIHSHVMNHLAALERHSLLKLGFHGLVEATRAIGTEAPALEDTSHWRKFVPKSCVDYAENPDSISRCEHESGSKAALMASYSYSVKIEMGINVLKYTYDMLHQKRASEFQMARKRGLAVVNALWGLHSSITPAMFQSYYKELGIDPTAQCDCFSCRHVSVVFSLKKLTGWMAFWTAERAKVVENQRRLWAEEVGQKF